MRHRYLLHGDLHLGPNFRVFVQMLSGLESGRIGGPRPEIDEDAFDLHQAFADMVLSLGANGSLTARLGRQELRYGSGRLVDVRDGHLPRSFDAARLLLRAGGWSVDGFWSKALRNRTGVFDDDTDPQRSLWGIYAVHPVALLPDGHADLDYLGYENRLAQFDQGSGYELRHTLGSHLWGQPWPWEYDVELVGQGWQVRFGHDSSLGDWLGDALHSHEPAATAAPGTAGRRHQRRPGPEHRQPPDVQPTLPDGGLLQFDGPGRPAELDSRAPRPRPPLRPRGDGHRGLGLLLADEFEGRALPAIRQPVPDRAAEPRAVCRELAAVTMTWTPLGHITMLASYAHFFAGPFIRETPPGKDIDYFTIWITYKF